MPGLEFGIRNSVCEKLTRQHPEVKPRQNGRSLPGRRCPPGFQSPFSESINRVRGRYLAPCLLGRASATHLGEGSAPGRSLRKSCAPETLNPCDKRKLRVVTDLCKCTGK